MATSNHDLLAKLASAYKAITRSDMGSSLLTEEKANRFIRVVEESTPILRAARRLTMNSHTRDIDRILFAGRILQATTENSEITNEQKTNTYTNQLTSAEIGGFVGITDSTLEDNIERGNFEDTVIDLLASQVGRDLEHLFISGDTSLTGDPLLKVTDGWLKKAANKVDGDATTPQFDKTNIESMLNAMLLAVPKKYLTDRNQWRFYVTWEMEDDYRDVLRARNTALGDTAQTSAMDLRYKGIALEYAPQMPAGTALLVPPSNMVYGLYRDIRIEPDRVAKGRKTDFVVTLRADCHYEDENAAVVAVGYTG
jgi:Phage capsid family